MFYKKALKSILKKILVCHIFNQTVKKLKADGLLNGPEKMNKTGKNDSPNEDKWAVSRKKYDGKNEIEQT